MRYQILRNKDIETLTKRVNDALQAGWELHSWVFQDNEGYYVQSLTKDNTAKANKVIKKA